MNYIRVVDEIFSQFSGPAFRVKFWNGSKKVYGQGKKIAFTLRIQNASTVQRLLSQGSLGFGESYMDGSLEIEGDLEAYLRLRHEFKKVRRSPRLALATLISSRTIPKDRKSQISYHYDLGNDFFEMILDRKTMSYSSGKYETGHENLSKAQYNKLKFICDWLDLKSGSQVLDLGSGWGGFARMGAAEFGWDVTGYSLSHAQTAYCRENIQTKHSQKLLHFEEKDMTLFSPRTFDGIVVLEAIEHVGQKNLSDFFLRLKKSLKKGAPLIIQTTGRYHPHRVDRWTLKYVFPGGYLPSIGELFDAARSAGLVIEEMRDDTPDYIHTMTEWIRNLESHKVKIEKKFDEPLFRLWDLWMHGAKVNFELGAMNLFRLKMRNPD